MHHVGSVGNVSFIKTSLLSIVNTVIGHLVTHPFLLVGSFANFTLCVQVFVVSSWLNQKENPLM